MHHSWAPFFLLSMSTNLNGTLEVDLNDWIISRNLVFKPVFKCKWSAAFNRDVQTKGWKQWLWCWLWLWLILYVPLQNLSPKPWSYKCIGALHKSSAVGMAGGSFEIVSLLLSLGRVSRTSLLWISIMDLCFWCSHWTQVALNELFSVESLWSFPTLIFMAFLF